MLKASLIIGFLVAALASARAISLIVPNGNALTEGGYDNEYPFGDLDTPLRYQQVYDSSQFQLLGTNGGYFNSVAFRYGGSYNTTPMIYNGLTITLCTTTQLVDHLTTNYTSYMGADSMVVYSGKYTNGVTAPPADGHLHPWPFPMVIPFSTPFFYNPTNGNLLIDIQITGNSGLSTGNGPPGLDAAEVLGDSVSRTGKDYFNWPGTTPDTVGLVTKFDVTPLVAPNPQLNVTALSPTNLLVAGSNCPAGVLSFVLATTNLTVSSSNWVPVSTNTFGTNSAFASTNNLDPTVPQQFYILQLQ